MVTFFGNRATADPMDSAVDDITDANVDVDPGEEDRVGFGFAIVSSRLFEHFTAFDRHQIDGKEALSIFPPNRSVSISTALDPAMPNRVQWKPRRGNRWVYRWVP
jgi:hypothetical protein